MKRRWGVLLSGLCGMGTVMLVLSACSGPGPAEGPSAQLPDTGRSDSEVVAYLGGNPITYEELRKEAHGDLMRLEFDKYDALVARLNAMIETRLIDAEAKARGLEVDQLLKAEINDKIVPPSESEIIQFYDRNRNRTGGQPLEAVRSFIVRDLERMLTEDRRVEFIEELKQRAGFKMTFDPPLVRVDIPEGTPTRGPADAPVTMIEFSDFQCPFCRRAHPTVERVLEEYGDKIHFAYRDYPLKNHPRARPASVAARCADEQGKYWDYHNDLMSIEGDLTDGDLTQRAGKLGLNEEQFSACYQSGKYTDIVEQGFEDALSLGVKGTPTFFINGRIFRGAQPFEEFKAIIDRELERAQSGS